MNADLRTHSSWALLLNLTLAALMLILIAPLLAVVMEFIGTIARTRWDALGSVGHIYVGLVIIAMIGFLSLGLLLASRAYLSILTDRMMTGSKALEPPLPREKGAPRVWGNSPAVHMLARLSRWF